MQAVEISAPGEARLVERPEPRPGPSEALLRVRRIGYCGTDLSTYRGVNPLVSYPRIPGHEIAATIEALGPAVSGPWQVGQDVLVMPYTSCGACSACRWGRPNCCASNQTLGVQRDGALAQWIVAPTAKLLAAPGLSLAELALVEPLTIGFHAMRRARVVAGETVAVIGCGAIGLGVIAGARFRGAAAIAVDVDDAKLDVARACGADHAINFHRESLHERLLELTAGLGPQVVVEAVGLAATYTTALAEATFAGRVVCLGYAKAPFEVDSKLVVLKELDVLGSRNALPDDFADVAGMLSRGGFPSERIVTHVVPLAAAPDAMRRWSEQPGEVTKIQVDLDR